MPNFSVERTKMYLKQLNYIYTACANIYTVKRAVPIYCFISTGSQNV